MDLPSSVRATVKITAVSASSAVTCLAVGRLNPPRATVTNVTRKKMFIMNTRSTMAVMSNSGGSGSSRRAMSWSEPVSPRLKLDDSMACLIYFLGSILEEVEDPHQAGAECVLQDANPRRETSQHKVEGD